MPMKDEHNVSYFDVPVSAQKIAEILQNLTTFDAETKRLMIVVDKKEGEIPEGSLPYTLKIDSIPTVISQSGLIEGDENEGLVAHETDENGKIAVGSGVYFKTFEEEENGVKKAAHRMGPQCFNLTTGKSPYEKKYVAHKIQICGNPLMYKKVGYDKNNNEINLVDEDTFLISVGDKSRLVVENDGYNPTEDKNNINGYTYLHTKNAHVIFDRKSDFQVHNGIFHLERGLTEEDGPIWTGRSPIVEIQNSAYLTMRGYGEIVVGGGDESKYNSQIHVDNGGTFHLHGGIFRASTDQFEYHGLGNNITFRVDNEGTQFIVHGGVTNISGTPHIHIQDKSNIKIENSSLFIMQGYEDSNNKHTYYSPSFVMNNASQILMNCADGKSTGPLINCERDHFTFIGNGASGIENSSRPSRPPYPNYSGQLSGRHTDNIPRFRIGNSSTIVVDGPLSGSTYMHIAPDSDCDMTVYMSGNSFFQSSGNAHREFHHGSKVVMRGSLDADMPAWKDCGIYSPVDNQYNIVQTTPETSLEDIRPCKVKNTNRFGTLSGPNVGLYDDPVITIRGTWIESIEQEKAIIEATISDTSFLSITTSKDYKNLTSTQKAAVDEIINNDYYDYELIDSSSIKVSHVEERDDEVFISLTLSNVINHGPRGWTAHLPKKENSPFIEIIENSQIKTSGSFTIEGTSEGVTFGDGTLANSVTFTFEELAALKELLS